MQRPDGRSQRPSKAQAAASGDPGGREQRTGLREAADSLVIVAKQLGADEAVKLELFTDKKTVLEALLDNDEENGEGVLSRASTALVQKALAASPAGPLLKKMPFLGVFTSEVVAGERVFPMMDVAIDPR